MRKLSIQIITENSLLAAGIISLIKDIKECEVSAHLTIIPGNVCNEYQKLLPDLVILDLKPNLHGIPILKKLVREKRQPVVLAIATRPDPVIAYQAMMEGADGFISQMINPELFIQSVTTLIRGDSYIEPEIASGIAIQSIKNAGNANPFAQLTGREMSVCLLMMEGMKCSDIAEIINISPKTSSNYRTKILDKLSLENECQLLRLGIRAGVIFL